MDGGETQLGSRDLLATSRLATPSKKFPVYAPKLFIVASLVLVLISVWGYALLSYSKISSRF